MTLEELISAIERLQAVYDSIADQETPHHPARSSSSVLECSVPADHDAQASRSVSQC